MKTEDLTVDEILNDLDNEEDREINKEADRIKEEEANHAREIKEAQEARANTLSRIEQLLVEISLIVRDTDNLLSSPDSDPWRILEKKASNDQKK